MYGPNSLEDLYPRVISKRLAAVSYINNILTPTNPACATISNLLPVNIHNLLKQCYDGVLLCYLVAQVPHKNTTRR